MTRATGLNQPRFCLNPGTESNSGRPEKPISHLPQRPSSLRRPLRLRQPPSPRLKRRPKSVRNTSKPGVRNLKGWNTDGNTALSAGATAPFVPTPMTLPGVAHLVVGLEQERRGQQAGPYAIPAVVGAVELGEVGVPKQAATQRGPSDRIVLPASSALAIS